jgi:hypothetical protein
VTLWSATDGDAADPDVIGGVPVIDRLRERRDEHGALVALEDGRYAVTGSTVASGSSDVVRTYARQRLASAPAAAEAQWWEEVIAALRR